MKLFAMLAIAAVVGMTLPSAQASVILNIDSGGLLTGAQNVDVGGNLLDVTFTQGLCFDVFSGCDAVSDFNFTDYITASAAAQALLDTVFTGAFDTTPTLVSGCADANGCPVVIPFGMSEEVDTVAAFNSDQESLDSVQFIGLRIIQEAQISRSFAVFSVADPNSNSNSNRSQAVPEPAGLLLFGFGLTGLAGIRRRRANF